MGNYHLSHLQIKASLKNCKNLYLLEVNDVQPVRKPHFKGVKKRKWIYDEPKNFPGSGMRRGRISKCLVFLIMISNYDIKYFPLQGKMIAV